MAAHCINACADTSLCPTAVLATAVVATARMKYVSHTSCWYLSMSLLHTVLYACKAVCKWRYEWVQGGCMSKLLPHTHMQAHVMTCCRTCVHTQYIYMCIQNRDVDSIEMREMYISQDLLCTSMYISQDLLHSLMILECNTCNKRYLNTPLLHVRTVFR